MAYTTSDFIGLRLRPPGFDRSEWTPDTILAEREIGFFEGRGYWGDGIKPLKDLAPFGGAKGGSSGGGVGSGPSAVSTPADLADVDAAEGDLRYVSAPGLDGYYQYVLGDYKARVEADFKGGIYQLRTDVPSTEAVWKRIPLPGNKYRTSWFGIKPDDKIAAADKPKAGEENFTRFFAATLGISTTHHPRSRAGLMFEDGLFDVDDSSPVFPGVDISSENGSGYTTIRVSSNRGWLFLGDPTSVTGFTIVTTGVVSPRVPGDNLAVIRSQGGGNRTIELNDLVFDVAKIMNNPIACDVTPVSAENPKAYLKLIMRDVHVKACGRMGCEVLFHNGAVFGSNCFVDIDRCSFTDPGSMPLNDRIGLSLSGPMAMKRVHNTTFTRNPKANVGDGSLIGLELVSGGPVDIQNLRFVGEWGSYVSNSFNGDGFRISGMIRDLFNENTATGVGMLYISAAQNLKVDNVNLKGGVQVYCQDLGDDVVFTGMNIDSVNESAFIAQNAEGIKLLSNYLKASGSNAAAPIVNFFSVGDGVSARNYAHGNIIAKPPGAPAPFISGAGTGDPVRYVAGGNQLVEA